MKAQNLAAIEIAKRNAELIEKFASNMRITDEICSNSITKYRDSMKKFLSVTGEKHIGDINNQDVDNFIIKMKDNGASGSRIANVIAAVKKIVSHLQKEGLVKKKLNLDKVRKPKIGRKCVNYLTDEEIKLLLSAIQDDINKGKMIRKIRMMVLARLLLQTGARIGEALFIKIKDIDRVNLEIPVVGKGGKPRNLYINQDVLDWIDRYLEIRKSDNEFLFVALSGNSQWKQTDVGRSFRYYKNLSGISKPFTLHTLRHTTATQLSFKGIPMNTIQAILGHERLETTIRYYIGPVEDKMAKRIMQDENNSIIPK